MTVQDPIETLLAFGFTETEARIYCFLLEESPATGYRISHAIGKAAANTYKALATLEQKGAIVVESGENRLCRATPPDELLAALSQNFEARRAEAKNALGKLHTPSTDHRVYQLSTVEQVLSRARAMLESAGDIAAFDITPGAARLIEDDVATTIARGIKVAATMYEMNDKFASDTCLIASSAEQVLKVWPGQQINLVVDARETLLAFLNRDCTDVIQAVWTNSRFLSVLHYNSIASEIIGHRYRKLMPNYEPRLDPVEQLALTVARPPGLGELLREAGLESIHGENRE